MKASEPLPFDARWSGPDGGVLVEIKRTSNARDLRDALLALIYVLLEQEDKATQGLCVLTNTRLSEQRLHEELARFRSVINPQLSELIFLADCGN